jgi:hypothetical protein
VKLFHRIDLSGKEPEPVYLRVEDIQYVQAYSAEGEDGCTVRLRGWGAARDKYDMGTSMRLAETAEEVVKACGYNTTPVSAMNTDATLILAGALRAEYEMAVEESKGGGFPNRLAYLDGYTDGVERCIDIAQGKGEPRTAPGILFEASEFSAEEER